MFAIKKIYFLGLLILLAVIGIIRYWESFCGVPVLNYHQINSESHNILTLSPQEFEAQMAYLHDSGYTTITPSQLADYLQYHRQLPAKPVLITFDDGYEDNYRVAYPILKKYNFTATFFIITDFAGTNEHYMTWNQLSEMQEHGFSLGSHTLNHVLLEKATMDDIYFQLEKSREALQYHLDSKAEYLAYPGGSYDSRVIAAAKKAGYRAAFTVDLGRNNLDDSSLFTLHRIPIFAANHTFLHFWLRLKATPALLALQHIKDLLTSHGITGLAGLIIIP